METPPRPAGAPWINPENAQRVVARDGDVWISAPAKSGTNWMLNIVHQVLSGGDDSFQGIHDVVPWPEFVERPGQPAAEVIDRVEAMPSDKRRAFKSHAAPPELRFVRPGEGKDVKYIVVCRNPEEALVSFKRFLEQHTDAFYEMWQVPVAALTRPDFPTFYREVFDARGMQGMFFGFVAGWWPLRHEPNVLLMHFADMKRDFRGSLRTVARFLEVERDEAAWATIERFASFEWMKENTAKFETHSHSRVPVLQPGAMVRKGKLGAAHEDGMTDEIAQHLRQVGARILTDDAARTWLYEGGSIA